MKHDVSLFGFRNLLRREIHLDFVSCTHKISASLLEGVKRKRTKKSSKVRLDMQTNVEMNHEHAHYFSLLFLFMSCFVSMLLPLQIYSDLYLFDWKTYKLKRSSEKSQTQICKETFQIKHILNLVDVNEKNISQHLLINDF